MDRLLDPQEQIALNSQTVNQLLEQIAFLLNQHGITNDGTEALKKLSLALKAVLPHVPQPLLHETNEISLENDIRQEIRIAGANENG